MDERRIYPREELVAAMICEFNARSVSTHCVVKNVSLDGVLLECPIAEEVDEGLDVGDSISIMDILEGDRALFNGHEGEIAWVYKRFFGLHFPEMLMDSPEQLRSWLEERHLL